MPVPESSSQDPQSLSALIENASTIKYGKIARDQILKFPKEILDRELWEASQSRLDYADRFDDDVIYRQLWVLYSDINNPDLVNKLLERGKASNAFEIMEFCHSVEEL